MGSMRRSRSACCSAQRRRRPGASRSPAQRSRSIASTDDQAILTLETETLAAYRRTADMLLPRLDSAVAHHPAFMLADTVRMRRDSVASLLSQTRGALASAEQMVNGELARLQTEP